MVDNNHENPPGAHPEQPPQPAENASTSSSTTNTLRGRIGELIRKHKELESLKAEFAKEDCITDVEEQNKARVLKADLRKIVEEIQRPSSPQDRIQLPTITQNIIGRIKITDINSESAPVIYELLRISSPGSGYDFNSPEGMKKALDVMLKICPFEPLTARVIINTMIMDAKSKGCTNEQLKEAIQYINPLQKPPEQIKEQRKRRELQYQAALMPIQGLVLGDVAQERIRLGQGMILREAISSGQISAEEGERLIQGKIDTETNNMQGEILGSLNYVIASLASSSERLKALGEYNTCLSRLRKEGKISQADFLNLQELPNNPTFTKPIDEMNKSMEGDDLVQRAMSVFVPSQEQIQLLRGISSAQSFINLLKTTQGQNGTPLRYMTGGINGDINWDAFMKDVKGIFGELLSIADRNPNQFFEQAFNPMYEGHLYQVLLQRIKHLGSQISSSDDEWFKKEGKEIRKISITEQIADPAPTTSEPPFKLNVFEKKSELDLSVAIGNYLANNMSDYKHVREHLHNINAICTQGLGWEQLKNYSERLGLDKLDRLVRQEEDLSLASNFYSAALQQEVAVNGRVTMTQFGLGDEVWQLNSAERKAFFQMKAYLGAKHPELKGAALNQQAIQKIRMAAAIAYGLTGEFWNIMLTARMPIGSEKAINGAGEEVKSVLTTFVGTNHRGYEKMIGELDLDMVLQRFALPKLYNALRYCPRYRDMKNPPSAWSKNGYFYHDLAYDARFLIENAMVNGRSNKLIDMDEQYVYFLDYMRTKCVGLFARAGWRFTNSDTCKVYVDSERKNINYLATLTEVRRMGSYITKRFLDELKPEDFGKMSREEVRVFLGIDKAGNQLTPGEIKQFIYKDEGRDSKFIVEPLYDRILFSHMGRVAQTKFLQLEDRRWTPEGEKMLRTHLCDYLAEQPLGKQYPREILNFHVYNMYVSALTLAEKSTWMRRKKEDPDYTFNSSDIDSCRDELESFFEQYKTNIGVHNEFGKKIEILENKEDFIRILKGFQSRLTSSIDLPRYHNANNTGTRESLQRRFANMLSTKGGDSKGNIENLIAGDDFDMENYYFNAAGGFGTTRMMGETFEVTSKMNPAIGELINKVLPDFVKGQYNDIKEVEKYIKEKFVPQFEKIHGAIAKMDKAQADEYCISLALFVSNLVGKDRISRIKGIGTMVDWYKRQRYGAQSSLYQDFFRTDLMRPTHAMDSDEIYAFGHIVMNALNIAFDEKIPDHMETTFSIFGRPIMKKMVYKGEKLENAKLFGFIPYKKTIIDEGNKMPWYSKVFDKAAGVTKITRFLETYLPGGIGALFLILLAMAYLANQKNKKK